MKSTIKPPVQFPLTMVLRYQTKSGPAFVSGTSVTKRIGSRQIVFTANEDIQEKTKLQLAISWPVLLENRVRLQVIMDAIVTKVEDGVAEATILQYDFRTRKDPAVSAAGAIPEQRQALAASVALRPRGLSALASA
ncbi:MAG TPA: hypothetical protein VKV17_02610 [Bryobacteraceae bacterium]|nr:hypothetical protein [Bryobacteraceae bacterium]